MSKTTNVLLTHGAWADGSCWAKVIPVLQAQGLKVVAAQIPLTSLEDDIAVTRHSALCGADKRPQEASIWTETFNAMEASPDNQRPPMPTRA